MATFHEAHRSRDGAVSHDAYDEKVSEPTDPTPATTSTWPAATGSDSAPEDDSTGPHRAVPSPAKKAPSATKKTKKAAPAKKAAAKKPASTAKKATTKKSAAATKQRAEAPATARTRPANSPENHVYDVLIIGGGPGGSACAYWLADAGWDVAVVEKKVFPRVKTCGDGLTPRAVRQLADMGMEDDLADGAHKYYGLRAYGFGQSIEMRWPEHSAFPDYGYTITRHDLDGMISDRAAKAGATIWQGTEAVAPLLADAPDKANGSSAHGLLPACTGAVVKDKETGKTREVKARYIVVADGANSRFGRALGSSRHRELPMGMALRGYYTSDRHDEPYIESHLDIRDLEGNVVPGYGWIFPLGDGRVNVGVGLLSTDRRWKGVNTTQLMEAFVHWAPKSWGLSAETCLGPPTGGKLPMGLSMTPRTGPNALLIGDAAGSINPFNGEGIAYGYETGRLAAASLGRSALR